MPIYIAILRGINVSGQKLIKMEKLRKMFEVAGYENVSTFIQSGNIIFTSDESQTRKLEMNITNLIRKNFGFDVPVIVLTKEKLKRIVDNNPFMKDTAKDSKFMHVTFLKSSPKDRDYEGIESNRSDREEVSFSDEAVYLYRPNGVGKSKLSNNLIESRLHVTATTRNWKTTMALFEIAVD